MRGQTEELKLGDVAASGVAGEGVANLMQKDVSESDQQNDEGSAGAGDENLQGEKLYTEILHAAECVDSAAPISSLLALRSRALCQNLTGTVRQRFRLWHSLKRLVHLGIVLDGQVVGLVLSEPGEEHVEVQPFLHPIAITR